MTDVLPPRTRPASRPRRHEGPFRWCATASSCTRGCCRIFLGAAWAYGMRRRFRPRVLLAGLFRHLPVGRRRRSFNEYFDAKMGTDRVFNPSDDENTSRSGCLSSGVAAFALAACHRFLPRLGGGWPIVLYTLLGGAAAVLVRRPADPLGLSRAGRDRHRPVLRPWMTWVACTCTRTVFLGALLLASLVPGLLIMALATVNNIPDFHQDRLVGKEEPGRSAGTKKTGGPLPGAVRAGASHHRRSASFGRLSRSVRSWRRGRACRCGS